MTLWLEWQEKIQCHVKYLEWCIKSPIHPQTNFYPHLLFPCETRMTKHPSVKAIPIGTIMDVYGAIHFWEALAQYIVRANNPDASWSEIEDHLKSFTVPIAKFPVFHWIIFISTHRFQNETTTTDAAHIQPSRKNNKDQIVAGRFDTVLVNNIGRLGQTCSVDNNGMSPFCCKT